MTSSAPATPRKFPASDLCAFRKRGVPAARRVAGLLRSCSLLILSLFAIALPALGRDFETLRFRAAHLDGKEVPFNIILPQGYEASAKRYPVVYLLHGYTRDYSDWVVHSGVTRYAHPYPEIIVMPEAGTSWYVNNYADPKLKWQDYFIHDVVPYVDQHFRTIAARQGRAVAGISMGGYGALLLGLRYPAMFAAVASLSGVVTSAQPSFEQFVTDDTALRIIRDDFGPPGGPGRDDNDLFELVKHLPPSQAPQLYLSIGTSDKYLETNRDFVKLLAGLKIPYRYKELSGGHEWVVWDPELKGVLAILAPEIGAGSASDH